jgi:hypothetical protein
MLNGVYRGFAKCLLNSLIEKTLFVIYSDLLVFSPVTNMRASEFFNSEKVAFVIYLIWNVIRKLKKFVIDSTKIKIRVLEHKFGFK